MNSESEVENERFEKAMFMLYCPHDKAVQHARIITVEINLFIETLSSSSENSEQEEEKVYKVKIKRKRAHNGSFSAFFG